MSGQRNYREGEIIVTFHEGVTRSQAEDVIASFSLELKTFFPPWPKSGGGTVLVFVPKGEERAWAAKFKENKSVVAAGLNRVYYVR